jgi:hypothetical protein
VKTAIFSASAALALGAVLAGPISANAASDHRTFEGTVVHVSRENIKVHGTEGGQAQTISFLIDHGTKLAHELHPGEYVRIVFDQRLLGIRHADEVVPYNNSAMKVKS